MCVHEFTGQAILPENVQRQKEAVEVVVEEEATSVTAVTGYQDYVVAAAIGYLDRDMIEGLCCVLKMFSQAWSLCKGVP